MKPTFGADIEVFFTREEESISSQKLFPKHERIELPEGVIERDGYAAEVQPSPSGDSETVIHNVSILLNALQKIMRRKKMEFDHRHIVRVNVDKLRADKDEDSLIFGCKPDMNSYKREFNTKPNANEISERTAGGHIHVGLGVPMEPTVFAGYRFYRPVTEEGENYLLNVLNWMDALIGLPSVIFDIPSSRRQIYGMAGDFRFTAPNIEYRSLSNYMLMSPELLRWTLEQTKKAIEISNLPMIDVLGEKRISEIRRIINTCDQHYAVVTWGVIVALLKERGFELDATLPVFNHKMSGWF